MIEEKIVFHSEGLRIQGLLCVQEGYKGLVITHPHPLYGGTMYNQVVETVLKVSQVKGYSTLRFNFRGTAGSEGRYDQGKGEQKDVTSAVHYLYDLGKRELVLAGYSFGAWINAKIGDIDSNVRSMVMVSPPVNVLDFSFLSRNPKIKLVVTGGWDDIAPADKIRDLLPTWNPEADFQVVEGADHFFTGKIDLLTSILSHAMD